MRVLIGKKKWEYFPCKEIIVDFLEGCCANSVNIN